MGGTRILVSLQYTTCNCKPVSKLTQNLRDEVEYVHLIKVLFTRDEVVLLNRLCWLHQMKNRCTGHVTNTWPQVINTEEAGRGFNEDINCKANTGSA